MGRNHRNQAPSFMRYNHHQSTSGENSAIDNNRDCNSITNSSLRLLSNIDTNETSLKHNENNNNTDNNSHYHHHQIPHIITTPETGYTTDSRETDLNAQQKMSNLRHHHNSTTMPKITAVTNM